MNKEKRRLIKQFINKGYSWYGDESIDDRLKILLPNHFLDIKTGQPERLSFYDQDVQNTESQILEYTASFLKGTYSALTKRYHLIQPLTASWDTRILLSASKNFKNKIQYYVFDRPSISKDDIQIPKKLSNRLNLNFKSIKPKSLNKEWLTKYKKEHICARISPVTSNIQYHYYQNYDKDVVNINGNAAEIARCYYGHTNKKITLNMLLTFSGYHQNSSYIIKHIREWLQDVKEFSKENAIPILDLFYWEQRMGRWGSLYPSEQDIAIEEISPFNNRALLIKLLNVDPQKRKSPD